MNWRAFIRQRLSYLLLLQMVIFNATGQSDKVRSKPDRPALVVGLVVDQMRWDYLYRYYDRYGNGGFKRLLNEGFSCENAFINHLPSATAVGHATIYTGSVPAIHGIAGNEWIDQLSGRSWYCTEDTTASSIGGTGKTGKMSPANLLSSTITDELMLAQNFKSRILGISVKDRAAILPAGHTPTGAFWLDDATGNFISSSWYMNTLPTWVKLFNEAKNAEQLVANDWHTLYPIDTYTQSDADDVAWEGRFGGEKTANFPHLIADAYRRKPGIIRNTPFGNNLTLKFAEAAIQAYQLGKGPATDFLAINFAATDYVGHMFGVNSIEIEDTYLRLDKALSDLFALLDKQVGKGGYLVFLTADHGAAHAKGFMDQHRFPTGYWDTGLVKALNQFLLRQMGVGNLVKTEGDIGASYQVNFNNQLIADKQLDISRIKKLAVDYLKRQPGILYAADMENIGAVPIPEVIKTAMINGYHYKRSGTIQIIPDPGWMPAYSKTGTTHGAWNPYDTHIPLLFMGHGVRQGSTNRTVQMTDIAPTLAAMLHIQMPSGSIGSVITETIKKK